MKNRVIALALLTAVLLTGCNSESASTNNTETQTQETETQATEIIAEEETETETETDFSIPAPTTDYLVEGIELTKIVSQDTTLRSGPNETDFESIGSLSAGEEVLVYGIVTEYKGAPTLWYQLPTGEFIDGTHLLDPNATTESTETTDTTNNSISDDYVRTEAETIEWLVQETGMTPEELVEMGLIETTTEVTVGDGIPHGGGISPDGSWD